MSEEEINPLFERSRQNEISRRIRWATLTILGTLIGVLIIVLTVFGNDVNDTLAGIQKLNEGQTAQLTSIIEKNANLQKLTACLLQFHIGGNFSKDPECQHIVEQAQNGSLNSQIQEQGPAGPQGPKGDTGKTGPSSGLIPDNIPILGAL